MRETILIADDDADNREIMRAALSRAGFQVALARDGAEAMACVRAAAPALVLLDLSMPGASGWEVVRWLKAEAALRDIPVLAYTAHAMAGDERRVLDAGFDGYISKPCIPRLAVEHIQACLARRQPAAGAPPAVLVVDDCPANRALVEATLRREGYRLLEASDGAQGLELMRRERPALAIVDMMMPGLDGSELVRRARLEGGPALFLMLTALSDDESAARARKAGAEAWMTKPFVPEELRRRVRELLADAAAGRGR